MRKMVHEINYLAQPSLVNCYMNCYIFISATLQDILLNIDKKDNMVFIQHGGP